jgi:hypothetical protein
MKTIFLRVLDTDDKAAALRAALQEPTATDGRDRFEVNPASFSLVPRSPFAYWATARTLQLFRELAPFESAERAARHGAATLNNGRFLRLAWEVTPEGIGAKWMPYAKGGAYSPFYDDVHLLVNWYTSGAELKQYVSDVRESNGWGPHWTAVLNGYDYYLRPGLTWPSRTQSGFAPRVLPKGCLFDCKGNAAFFKGDCQNEILGYLAVFLSDSFRALVGMQMAFGSYDVGVVQRTPVPRMSPDRFNEMAAITRRAFVLKREIDTITENSHAFALPALLQVTGDNLAKRTDAWAERERLIEREIAVIQAEIDAHCLDLYGIDKGDQRAIAQGPSTDSDHMIDTETKPAANADADTDLDEDSNGGGHIDDVSLAADVVSWAVGVAFGRFDLRLATGERPLPAEPEPFDPLPACSPAMLTCEGGLPVTSTPAGYPLVFPENGILVDDRGQACDLTAAVRLVFDRVFKANADVFWSEITRSLDPQGEDLRGWLASSFFEHHLKRHSKSRRRAPILWQLAVPSGRYSIWLYAHRVTRDSFFQIQNDVVTSKLTHEERQLTGLLQASGQTPSGKERREIVAQETFVDELRALLDDVRRVAPLWDPTLDDGVVLTMAPLWRLVPQHKAWQKELKSKWKELADGKYDWAGLAMHLWPERVIPKCATDRSLAIAHGLEDTFWAEGDDDKWKPRATPKRQVAELVRERTSVAVKSALKSLLEAPIALANGSRGRGRRAANAAADGGAR